MARVNEIDIARVLSQQLKADQDIKWEHKDRCDYAEFKLKVPHGQEGDLMIIVTASLVLENKFSCNLLFRGEPIKRLEVNGRPHTNTCGDDCRFAWQTHKHVYRDDCKMDWAYAPEDITTQELEATFREFCVECGIDFEGNWKTPPSASLGRSEWPTGLE